MSSARATTRSRRRCPVSSASSSTRSGRDSSGPALADAITGIYAAYGVLGALLERARTGQGRLVEVSMLEAMAHFAVEPFAAYFALGECRNRATGRASRRPTSCAPRTTGCSRSTCPRSRSSGPGSSTALEAPELARDARFATRLARIENYEALGAELDRRFRRRPLAEWSTRLVRATTCHSRRSTASTRSSNDPQAQHLGLIVPVEARTRAAAQAVRPAVQFDGRRADVAYARRRSWTSTATRSAQRSRRRRLAGRRAASRAPGRRMMR